MKIGIYGGTFNPIHFGHLNLAIEIKEKHHLDKILMIPAWKNPLRVEEEIISAKHRLEMAKLAIEGIEGMEIIDWEAKRPEPSFTVDTVTFLKEKDLQKGDHNSYFLLVGADTIENFMNWKDPKKIIEIAPLLIGQRNGDALITPTNAPEWLKSAMQKGITPIKIFEISATEIRDRLKKNLYCGHLVPQKVLDYIKHNHLYY